MPEVPTHELDVPRIGYVHSWQRTQDEGWVRATLDTYGIPYTYFADQTLREGGLRERFDVIVYPHVGGDARSQVNGIAMTGELPLPYKRTEATPHLGTLDESDDIRGGMGLEGLWALATFVQEGGTLIVEGSTSTIFPEYGITTGVNVEQVEGLIAPGSVHRGMIADPSSPIAYGYQGEELPVFYRGDVVLSTGGAFGRLARSFGVGGSSPWQNTTPMAERPRLSPWSPGADSAREGSGADRPDPVAEFRQMARAFGMDVDESGPRVVVEFPDDAGRILLSGTLGGGQGLAGKPQVLDASVGDGHVVMFAIRPFWRWQTQGTFFLGFNAILNWNDLDAGGEPVVAAEEQGGTR
jgi:hypothetical protein